MGYLKLFGIAAFAIAAILYLASADNHKVVMGEQGYDLGDYKKITVNAAANLNVQSGQAYAINVKADAKDIKNLMIYVKGQTLVIENKGSMFHSWHGARPEIRVTLPLLKKFTLNGSSDADIQGVHGNFFNVVLNGSGNIMFDGESKELKAEINGSGDLKSKSFKAKEADVEINGSGSILLSGECKTLTIDISGSGDIRGKDFICEMASVDVIGSGDSDVYVSRTLDVDVMGSGEVSAYGKPEKVKDHSDKKNHVIIK